MKGMKETSDDIINKSDDIISKSDDIINKSGNLRLLQKE
jgi:hypothetical protein